MLEAGVAFIIGCGIIGMLMNISRQLGEIKVQLVHGQKKLDDHEERIRRWEKSAA